MLTPQEISEREFVKAVFGGYDMSVVDDFLETLAGDYSALYKENAILKSKIKVLVEKVEEYRSTEDAMRMALLTAQRMGEDLLSEAKQKSSELRINAEEELQQRIREISEAIADEETRLDAAKKETSQFVEASNELITQYKELLLKLDEIKSPEVIEPAPTREEKIVNAAKQIDSVVAKLLKDDKEEEAPQIADAADDEGEPTKLFHIKTEFSDWSDEDEPTSPRPKFNFDDLKFGSNYSVKEDE